MTDENSTLKWDINLLEKEIKEKIDVAEEGVTIMSVAFNACRRSFHLKLDVRKDR